MWRNFSQKSQVAAAKGKAVIASTAAFQSGAREFAKSKGIGLMRYFDPEKFKWELRRSASASAGTTVIEAAHLIETALSSDIFQSSAFDLYLQSPVRETNSLWDFFEDLVVDSSFPFSQTGRVANRRSKLSSPVPFYDEDELEDKAANFLDDIAYCQGEVNLDLLCQREAVRSGLRVERDVPFPNSIAHAAALGKITFDPPLIQVYATASPHRARDRFTLAHELSHHLLNHGRFLVRESCDSKDFSLQRSVAIEGADVARMEFQANQLAANLLMPRHHLKNDFGRLMHTLDITNRGFGRLYVDHQLCNLHHFDVVTSGLMQRYGVSRSAVKIRLESLGLLKDARDSLGFRSVQSYFDGLPS